MSHAFSLLESIGNFSDWFQVVDRSTDPLTRVTAASEARRIKSHQRHSKWCLGSSLSCLPLSYGSFRMIIFWRSCFVWFLVVAQHGCLCDCAPFFIIPSDYQEPALYSLQDEADVRTCAVLRLLENAYGVLTDCSAGDPWTMKRTHASYTALAQTARRMFTLNSYISSNNI